MLNIKIVNNPANQRSSGMSLISVVVALGVGAALLFSGMRLVNSASLAGQNLQTYTDALALKAYIFEAIDCKAVNDNLPGTCLDTPISINSVSNTQPVLIRIPRNGQYSQRGSLKLRALCKACPSCQNGKKIQIQYSRQNLWKDLHRGVPTPCVLN